MAQPIQPEPKFFLRPDTFGASPDDYRRAVFGTPPLGNMLGEKSTSYVEKPQSLLRIDETFPEAPIICLVRDPITRALSNVYFSIAHDLEMEAPQSALMRELEGRPAPPAPEGISVSPFDYLARSLYIDRLLRAQALFGPRLLVIQTEQLARAETIVRILRHLGISHCDQSLTPMQTSTNLSWLAPETMNTLRKYFRPSIESLLGMDSVDIDLTLWPSWSKNE